MAVEVQNVERLMGWLAEGSAARSTYVEADALAERLAALVFQGESGWPNHTDRADAYRDALGAWFAEDGHESRFAALTGPDADPGTLFDWFLPVVQAWEQRAAHAADLATDEQRRYSERARDDTYGLDYRYDRTYQVYEWYDEASGTWRDQTWADLYAASRHHPGAEPAGGETGAEWDENWRMFFRVGPGGVYEFADAKTPGEPGSGCGGTWLSHEQLLQQRAQAGQDAERSPQPPSPSTTPRDAIVAMVPDIASLVPGFDDLTDDEIAQGLDDFLNSRQGG